MKATKLYLSKVRSKDKAGRLYAELHAHNNFEPMTIERLTEIFKSFGQDVNKKAP